MVEQKATRRRFLVSAVACSGLISTAMGVALLRAGSAWAQSGGKRAGSLARMARLLYPHDGIADNVYADVIDSVLAAAADDPSIADTLNAALRALDDEQDADWFKLGAEQQVAALQAVETEPFFGVIQAAVRDRIYNHDAVWKHIGYPGSSVEHGGYVERGFDDIDWLPEEA